MSWSRSRRNTDGFPLQWYREAQRNRRQHSLVSLNLLDRFDTMVCAGDYVKSKPDREALLLAAARLGVAPEDCLVFEDTDMGSQAATAAAGRASAKLPVPWERASI
ncbi:MAG: HAD-IA family hydrolase [Candidatus Sulfotelmatobacter sp.]